MSRGNVQLLGRGALCVAFTDILISLFVIIIGIRVYLNLHYFTEAYSHRVRDLELEQFASVLDIFKISVGLVLLIAGLVLLFAFILCIGAKVNKAGFVCAWYVPNLILVSSVAVICLALTFTDYVRFVLPFPPLLCFRAFETWIVGEFQWELQRTKY